MFYQCPQAKSEITSIHSSVHNSYSMWWLIASWVNTEVSRTYKEPSHQMSDLDLGVDLLTSCLMIHP